MKKLLSIFIFLCLVSSLVACGQRQPVGEEPGEPIPTKPPQETNPDFVDNRYFINQDAPATKVFHFEGEDIELIYQNTLNKNDLPLEERPDNYGFYDIYVDKIGEDNTEFTFLDNTDILCGIFCNSYSPPLDIDPIGEELIVEKALEYLTAIYSSDMINSYILDACKFDQNQKQSYSICFYKALQGIKTDDQIWMTVRLDSKIKSFNAHNIYRYDQFIDTLPKINKPKTEEALMKQATERVAAKQTVTDYHVEYTIQNEYITMNEKGELVLAQEIFWSISGEPIPDKLCIPLTEGDIFYQPLIFE